MFLFCKIIFKKHYFPRKPLKIVLEAHLTTSEEKEASCLQKLI